MENRLSRRQIVVRLMLSAAGIAAAAFAGSSLVQRTRFTSHDGNENKADAPSFDDFLALSALVLRARDLDPSTARAIYDLMIDEPWGSKHMKELLASLRRAESGAPASAPPALAPAESWFASHLLTTWYLGMYFHEQRPTQRVTLEKARMYDALRGAVPMPFIEGTGFGAWSAPPSN